MLVSSHLLFVAGFHLRERPRYEIDGQRRYRTAIALIRQAFWKVRSMSAAGSFFSVSFFCEVAPTAWNSDDPEKHHASSTHSTIDECDRTITFSHRSEILRSEAKKYDAMRGQTIASLDAHLLVATRKGEASLYSNLIDEALGGQNIRRITLTFHSIDQTAWHKKALKYRIFEVTLSSRELLPGETRL